MAVIDETSTSPNSPGTFSYYREGSSPNSGFSVDDLGNAFAGGVDLFARNPAIPAYGFTPANLTFWRKALARVRGGLGQAKVLLVGDSITAGEGATLGIQGGWAWLLPPALNSYYVPTVRGLSIPRRTSLPDTRWTVGSGWTYLDSSYGWGGRAVYTATPGASGNLVFNPGINCDTFDIYHLKSGSQGTTSVTIGGIPTDLVAGAAPPDFIKTTLTRAAGMNTVTFAPPTGGSVFIAGVDAYLSTANQVRIGNAGVSSSRTTDWASIADSYQSLRGIQAYAPDLTIIMLGVNDSADSRPVETWKSAFETVANKAAETGDVITMSVFPSNTNIRLPFQAAYREELLKYVTSKGWPLIDLFKRYGASETSSGGVVGLGYQADGIHPTTLGHAEIMQAVLAGLTQI